MAALNANGSAVGRLNEDIFVPIWVRQHACAQVLRSALKQSAQAADVGS